MEFGFRDLDCAVAVVAAGVDGANARQPRLVGAGVARQLHDAGEFVDIAVFGRVPQKDLVNCWCCRASDPCRNLRQVAMKAVRQVLVQFEVHTGRSGTFEQEQRLVMDTGTDRIAGIRVKGTLGQQVIF